MFTRPAAVSDAMIVAALREGWRLDPMDAGYLAVGFGSHHWLARGADDQAWFVTVDDLAANDYLAPHPGRPRRRGAAMASARGS